MAAAAPRPDLVSVGAAQEPSEGRIRLLLHTLQSPPYHEANFVVHQCADEARNIEDGHAEN